VSRLQLVIFDCEGVLVDSERLAVRTEAQVLASLGWPLSEAEIVERFVGRSAEHMHHEIESHLGRSIDWDREFESRYRDAFARELRPVAGVEGALDRIDVPICVASSGTHEKINFSLGVTGLAARFHGRIFSVEDVEHGKPAPDLFLYAAEQMGRDPSACAVVEDSVSGVEAGIAAGMCVFAYAGGVTSASRLSLDGVRVFDQMAELPDLLSIDR
jgi:HAD superfamily hydrolase (TIGR01509 family)